MANAAAQPAPLRTQLLMPDGCTLKVLFKPCRAPLSSELHKVLQQDVVRSFGQWSYAAPEHNTLPRPPPLAVAHVLAGERGPDVRMCADPDDASSVTAMETVHKTQLENQQTILVHFEALDKELVLVPVKVKTGKTTYAAAYWGYMVPAHLLSLAAGVMHFSRLLLVFDLDETLLMAHTVDSLAQRIRRVNANRESKAAELRSLDSSPNPGMSPEELEGRFQALGCEMALLEAEAALLQADFDMLDFYRRDPQCRVLVKGPGGQARMVDPTWEKARNSRGEEVTRPVIRMEQQGRPLIITRINPEFKSTSVLLRPRAGWRVLKDYLSGMEDVRAGAVRKQRWEVFICTTAEKEYALEAWRLLDPEASLFPHSELAVKRMLCVPHPQKKDLLNVLRWEQVYAQMLADPQGQSLMVTDEMRARRPEQDTAAMSVIIDDRADVWEEASRRALMQVMPFHPHKEAAALDMGPGSAPAAEYTAARDSEGELLRVVSTLRELRSKFYAELDLNIKPEAVRLVSTGILEQYQAHPLEILSPFTPMSQLLATSSFPAPAALGQTEREDRASDLRLLANDATMMTAGNAASAANASAAGRGPSGDGAAAAAGVPAASDPRKRRAAAAGVGVGSDAQAAAGSKPADGNAATAAGAGAQQQGADTARDQQQQQQQQAGGFDFGLATSIEGLLQSLQGAAALAHQQHQGQPAAPALVNGATPANVPAAAAAAAAAAAQGNDGAEPAAKKQRVGDPPAAGPGTAPQQQQQQLPAAVPPPPLRHPLNNMLQGGPPVPGAAVPPSYIVSVLKRAAAASGSADDLAVYNDLFPAVLREVANPQQLLEVLAAISAQVRSGVDSSSVQSASSALKAMLGDQKFRIMQKVAAIIDSNAEVAKFFGPIMDPNTAAAAAGAAGGVGPPWQQQQQQFGQPLPPSGAGTIAGGSMGLQALQQQPPWQQQEQFGNGLVLMDMRGQGQQQQQQQQQPPPQTVDFRGLGAAAAAAGGPPPPGMGMPGQQQQQQVVFASGPPSGSNLTLTGLAVSQPQQQQLHMQYQPPQQQQQQQQQQLPLKGPELQPVVPPTREQLIALNNDPDCFSYTYGAMKKVTFKMSKTILQLMAEAGVKNSPSLMADLAREERGPRVIFQMFQGDMRPGRKQDLNDPKYTCILHYWGRPWGYGYAPTKKGAKLRAADEAAAHMYVSGVYFERLPPYTGPRPAKKIPPGAVAPGSSVITAAAAAAAASAAGDEDADEGGQPHAAAAAAAAGPAAAGAGGGFGSFVPPPQQQQQQPGQMAFQQQPRPPPGPPPPQQQQQQQQGPPGPMPQQQQQQQAPWRHQGFQPPAQQQQPIQQQQQSAEAQLKAQYGDRVKIKFGSAKEGAGVVIIAALHETADQASPVVLEASGSAPHANAAIEAAAAGLLSSLRAFGDPAAAAAAPPNPQQQQQQQGLSFGQWVPPAGSQALPAAAAAAAVSGPPSVSGALVQPQQQMPMQMPMQQPQQQQQPGMMGAAPGGYGFPHLQQQQQQGPPGASHPAGGGPMAVSGPPSNSNYLGQGFAPPQQQGFNPNPGGFVPGQPPAGQQQQQPGPYFQQQQQVPGPRPPAGPRPPPGAPPPQQQQQQAPWRHQPPQQQQGGPGVGQQQQQQQLMMMPPSMPANAPPPAAAAAVGQGMGAYARPMMSHQQQGGGAGGGGFGGGGSGMRQQQQQGGAHGNGQRQQQQGAMQGRMQSR